MISLIMMSVSSNAQQTVELCSGIQNTFTYWSYANTNTGQWTWTLNGDTISNTSSVLINWRDTGYYIIKVFYKDECDIVNKLYVVKVTKCPDSKIFYPNAFTPNGDGLNDGWSPIPFKIVEMKWNIWNRWGEKVFESKSIEGKWNGTYKNVPQPMGNFVFQCWWRGIDGKTGYDKGNLILIR